MSITLKILKALSEIELNYKGVRVNILGIPKFSSNNTHSLRSRIYQLEKSELIKRSGSQWTVTAKGRKYMETRHDSLLQFQSLLKNNPKNLIVIFDIPEKQKAERDWFRFQLRKFGFIMIQRSVWVGHAPLPRDFLDYVKKIGIRETFKTFKLSQPYNEKRPR